MQPPDFESMSEGEFPQMGPMEGGMNQQGQMQEMEGGINQQSQMQGNNKGMPGMETMQNDASDSEASESGLTSLTDFGKDTWILLIISVIIMLGGLIFGGLYRRR